MRVLIYKRTHKHDPDEKGIFGIQDCMGKIRNRSYDAVIGIGGKSAWDNIKYKINWIGLEPKKIDCPTKRGAMVVFAHFKLYEEEGENIKEKYPHLFNYMYENGNGNGKRHDISAHLHEEVFEEVKKILDSIKDCSASIAFDIECDFTLDTSKQPNLSKCGRCGRGKEAGITEKECLQGNTICKKSVRSLAPDATTKKSDEVKANIPIHNEQH